MSAIAIYLTHPQVAVDPSVPVPQWGLNAVGLGRVRRIVNGDWPDSFTRVVSSEETKAVETAGPIADALGLALIRRADMHENDRSATGFLPPDEFERVANAFFATPHDSIRGWERAVDAQARVTAAAEAEIAAADGGSILFVGHGAVGTLLYCHYAGLPISRDYDQPPGGGHYFSMHMIGRGVRHAWRPMEELPAACSSGS
ncbi:MAG: histidine phosphatase family protein [Pseudomonadota bacterium]